MNFSYLRDPLFLLCVLVYALNRLVLKSASDWAFLHNHLNDLICIPFWVPFMLYAANKLGLRAHQSAPDAYEILVPIVMWSVVFEIVLPQQSRFASYAVADHVDVFYYCLGGLLAGAFWSLRYRRTTERPVLAAPDVPLR